MNARTLRIVLVAAAASVVVSWLFDVVDAGFRGGPAVIAAVLVGLAVVGIGATLRSERWSRRLPKSAVDESAPTTQKDHG